jgi:hypothetical protein
MEKYPRQRDFFGGADLGQKGFPAPKTYSAPFSKKYREVVDGEKKARLDNTPGDGQLPARGAPKGERPKVPPDALGPRARKGWRGSRRPGSPGCLATIYNYNVIDE